MTLWADGHVYQPRDAHRLVFSAGILPFQCPSKTRLQIFNCHDQLSTKSKRKRQRKETNIADYEGCEGEIFSDQTSPTERKEKKRTPKIYCDLDGTIADFEAKCTELLGSTWQELSKSNPGRFWSKLEAVQKPGFFASLPWMSGKCIRYVLS